MVSAIKDGKSLSKFMIPIILFEKFCSLIINSGMLSILTFNKAVSSESDQTLGIPRLVRIFDRFYVYQCHRRHPSDSM